MQKPSFWALYTLPALFISGPNGVFIWRARKALTTGLELVSHARRGTISLQDHGKMESLGCHMGNVACQDWLATSWKEGSSRSPHNGFAVHHIERRLCEDSL